MLLNTPVPLKIPTESTWRTDIRLEESLFVKGLFIKCRQGQGNSAILQGKQHQRSCYHPGSRGTRGVSHWRTWEREGPVGCRRLSAGNTRGSPEKKYCSHVPLFLQSVSKVHWPEPIRWRETDPSWLAPSRSAFEVSEWKRYQAQYQWFSVINFSDHKIYLWGLVHPVMWCITEHPTGSRACGPWTPFWEHWGRYVNL